MNSTTDQNNTPPPKNTKKARFSDVVSTLITTHRQKSVQTLVIQSLSILFTVTILFLLSQVYYIFMPCLKALLWALLCGSALYPFKIRMVKYMNEWLDHLEQKNRSLCFGCLILPIELVFVVYNRLIEFISDNLVLFVLFEFRYQIFNLLRLLLPLLSTMIVFNNKTQSIIISITMAIVITLLLANQRSLIRSLSTVLMLMLIVYILYNSVGIVGQIILLVVVCMLIVGFISTVYRTICASKNQQQQQQQLNMTWILYYRRLILNSDDDQVDANHLNKTLGQSFITVLFTISSFVIAEHMNISQMILLMIVVHFLLRRIMAIIVTTQLINCIEMIIRMVTNKIMDQLNEDILLRTLSHFFKEADRLIKVGLSNSLDLLTSIGLFMIVGVILSFSSIFVSIKIYGECYQTIYLLQNELKNIELIQESINITMNQISDAHYFDNLINDRFNLEDDEKIFINKMLAEFRQNILPWLNSSSSSSSSSNTVDNNTVDEPPLESWFKGSQLMMSQWKSMMDYKNFNKLIELARTKASSYLPMIKSIVSVSYAMVFIILDSSTMLLSWLFNFIIFALALFYLLSSSQNQYKPIELMDHLVGSLVDDTCQQQQNRFSCHVEQVVNSIFAATIKISAFYGVYTWLLHSLFAIRICYIPAVIAALLAAIPLLNAYWASLPACLYLYYFGGNMALLKSLLMFTMAMLPSLMVDSSIYSDIGKGGHPYLTGLAITCGVVYYGVEGALFGPLWLCLLVIIVNMCTEMDDMFA